MKNYKKTKKKERFAKWDLGYVGKVLTSYNIHPNAIRLIKYVKQMWVLECLFFS